MSGAVRIVGAGPTGTLLAILLKARGIETVDIYESRPDPRAAPAESGRSINLALADRGIHALKTAGVFERLGTALLPMRGRFLHLLDGSTQFQAYGRLPNEEIYSISRHRLNQALIDIAAGLPGVNIHFSQRLEAVDFTAGTATLRNTSGDAAFDIPLQPLFATDGAASRMRRLMAQAGVIEASETDLEHGYKELSIPAAPDGSYRMRQDALHIWPRGNFMLIALPNDDGSFTATLFLPKRGPVSFASLVTSRQIGDFLDASFPDVAALMPARIADFERHPTGFIGTVGAHPWHHHGMALLLGDAAHAIVPFHGQGMNCCFEDCIELDQVLSRHRDWEPAFAEFSAARKRQTDAIALMALENYGEMSDRVADPKYQLQHELALELERRFPDRFIPRYSMVMFHHEIPYADALRRGALQAALLAELTRDPVTHMSQVDFERARRLIAAQLAPHAA
jgi:kynurenine 3-monooxygenase